MARFAPDRCPRGADRSPAGHAKGHAWVLKNCMYYGCTPASLSFCGPVLTLTPSAFRVQYQLNLANFSIGVLSRNWLRRARSCSESFFLGFRTLEFPGDSGSSASSDASSASSTCFALRLFPCRAFAAAALLVRLVTFSFPSASAAAALLVRLVTFSFPSAFAAAALLVGLVTFSFPSSAFAAAALLVRLVTFSFPSSAFAAADLLMRLVGFSFPSSASASPLHFLFACCASALLPLRLVTFSSADAAFSSSELSACSSGASASASSASVFFGPLDLAFALVWLWLSLWPSAGPA